MPFSSRTGTMQFLFGCYFKGFKLLRRYSVKHGLEVDLEDLDFEAIDKEIEEEKAERAALAAAGDDPPTSKKEMMLL